MDFKELTKLRNSNDEKIVFAIDKEFRPFLMKIIKSVLKTYSYMPESPESFYWLFMTKIPKLLRDMAPKALTNFDNVLASYCRIFTKNHSRIWFAKTHQILNRAQHYDETIHTHFVQKMSDSFIAPEEEVESNVTFEKILPKLHRADQKIFRLYFIEGKSYREVAMILGISVYATDKKIKKLIVLIKKII